MSLENINWYPGHMKKTRELIAENLKMVDVVIEVLDARIPVSSRNPIVNELISGKPRIVVLNKSDLADEAANAAWIDYFKAEGSLAMPLNSMTGAGIPKLLNELEKMQDAKNEGQMRKKQLRMMIVGVPNVGKSSLINRLTGKKSAKTGDRPGVTKGKQWLSIENGMQLLDTPGILWPKFEDPKVGLNLAFCGSIKDEILDTPSLALELITVLRHDYADLITARYKLTEDDFYVDEYELEMSDDAEKTTSLAVMEAICKRRGWILPGKRIDYERGGRTILDEFRSATIGRITLEKVSHKG
jgi:ribosome biogenesis GTPase A